MNNEVTINDIIVSIVAGGLRSYLQGKQELPDQSLSCGAPMSVRDERSSESKGNQVGMMMINMATDIGDPLKRVRAVHINAQQSKAFSNNVGSSMIMDISEILMPQVLGWSL